MRALTKLEQALPPRLRPRFSGLRSAVTRMAATSAPVDTVDPEVLTAFSAAIAERSCVAFRHDRHDGASSRRVVEPYRLVDTGRRWYLVAFDRSREDWRTFRVDRCRSVPSRVPWNVGTLEADGEHRTVLRAGFDSLDVPWHT